MIVMRDIIVALVVAIIIGAFQWIKRNRTSLISWAKSKRPMPSEKTRTVLRELKNPVPVPFGIILLTGVLIFFLLPSTMQRLVMVLMFTYQLIAIVFVSYQSAATLYRLSYCIMAGLVSLALGVLSLVTGNDRPATSQFVLGKLEGGLLICAALALLIRVFNVARHIDSQFNAKQSSSTNGEIVEN